MSFNQRGAAGALDCDDGDVCNGSEVCQAGNCVSGTPLDCDDGDACTNDSCIDGECVHEPIVCEETPPDLCTVDTCQDGVCVHSAIHGGRGRSRWNRVGHAHIMQVSLCFLFSTGGIIMANCPDSGACEMQLLVSISTIITPLVVAGGIWLTVALTMRHFKITRTVSYIERFHMPSMAETVLAVDDWLASSEDNDKRLQDANSDPTLHAQIRLLASFFTEIGIAYGHGTLHRGVAFDIWDYLVPKYWEQLEFFVKDRQEKDHSTLYKSFGTFAACILLAKKPQYMPRVIW